MQQFHHLDLFEQYIRGSLSAAAQRDFEKRLHTDEAFASEWAEYQFFVQTFQQKAAAHKSQLDAIRDELEQEGFFEKARQQAEAELAAEKLSVGPGASPISNASSGLWRRWVLVVGLLLLLVAGWIISRIDPPVNRSVNSSGDSTMWPVDSTNIPIDRFPENMNAPKSDPASTNIQHSTLPSIYAIEVDQFADALANRSKSATINATTHPEKTLFTGFVTQLNNTDYLVCSAQAVALASTKAGAVTGRDMHGNIIKLQLVGKDMFYDVAILSITGTTGAAPNRAAMVARESKIDGETSVMYAHPLDKTRYARQTIDGIMGNNRNGCFLFRSAQEAAPEDGAVFNARNEVLGLVTDFARAAFPGASSSPKIRMVLSSGLLKGILENILENGQTNRAYLGLAFGENLEQQEVYITDVVPGSPASPDADALVGDTIITINQQPVRDLFNALNILEEVRPGVQISIVHRGANGRQEHTFKAGTMNAKALLNIAATIFRDPDIRKSFSLLNSAEFRIEYYGGSQEMGVYDITGLCLRGKYCQDNIVSIDQAAEIVRQLALIGEGTMCGERNKKRTTINFTFSQRKLWF